MSDYSLAIKKILSKDINEMSKEEMTKIVLSIQENNNILPLNQSSCSNDCNNIQEDDCPFIGLRDNYPEKCCPEFMHSMIKDKNKSLKATFSDWMSILLKNKENTRISSMKIVADNLILKSNNFKITNWKIKQKISAFDKYFGWIEFFYDKEIPENKLATEKELIRKIILQTSIMVERKLNQGKLENALLASEQNFRLLAENAVDAIIITSFNGNILYANQKTVELTGYQKIELSQMKVQDLSFKQDYNAIRKDIIDNFSNCVENFQFENSIKTSRNKEVPVEIVVGETKWQSEAVFQVHIKDISDRKNAEKKVISSESKWYSLIKNSPAVVSHFDLNGNILVNTSSSGTLLPENLSDPSSNDYKLLFDSFEKIKKTGKTVTYPSCHVINGIITCWSNHVGPVFENDKLTGYLRSSLNVSKDKESVYLLNSQRRISFALTKLNNLNDLLRELLSISCDATDIRSGIIYRFDPEQKKAFSLSSNNLTKKQIERISSCYSDENFIRQISSEPVICGNEFFNKFNSDGKPDEKLNGYGIVPIYEKENIIAVLMMFSDLQLKFSEERVKHFSSISDQLEEGIHRIKKEEQQIESKRWLTSLVDSLPGLIYRAEVANNYPLKPEFISQGCYSLTGYTAEEFLHNSQLSYKHLVHPDDVKFTKPQIENAIRKKYPFFLIYRIITASGDIKWVWEQGVGIYSSEGKALYIEGSIKDITDNKEAEEKVIKNETKYQRLIEGLNEAVYRMSIPDGVCEYISPASRAVYGYTPDQLIHHNIKNIIHPDFKASYDKHWKSLLSGDIPTTFEYKIIDPEGKERWVVQSNSAVYDTAGKLTAIEGLCRNVTEEREIEKHIHSLTQDLLKAQENERQRISRDLHDHVAQDLSSLKIAIETIFSPKSEIPEEIKQKMSGASKMIQNSINNVRDIAYDLRPPGLDQLGLLRTVFLFCEEFGLKNGIIFDFFSAGMEKLKLDFDTEINIYRLVQEALRNIQRHAEAKSMTIRFVASYPDIILRIEDNGKGFDVEKRKISALNDKRMGLKSMEERVLLMKGKMKIQSRVNEGTKIIVKIPFPGGK